MKMQKEYINEKTDRINVCESRIRILQAGSNNNIVIIIDWLEGEPIKMVCEETSDITIRLARNPQFEKEVIGILEITSFSYIKKDEKYIVQFNFDFNLVGIIRLKCTKFTFFVSSEPLSMGGNDNRIKHED